MSDPMEPNHPGADDPESGDAESFPTEPHDPTGLDLAGEDHLHAAQYLLHVGINFGLFGRSVHHRVDLPRRRRCGRAPRQQGRGQHRSGGFGTEGPFDTPGDSGRVTAIGTRHLRPDPELTIEQVGRRPCRVG